MTIAAENWLGGFSDVTAPDRPFRLPCPLAKS
jgi:hypothetical protein